MVRRVQVDPGDQPVPRLTVQYDTMVALAKHLHELCRVGVVLHWHEHVVVAFQAWTTDKPVQGHVGCREMSCVFAPVVIDACVVVNQLKPSQVEGHLAIL